MYRLRRSRKDVPIDGTTQDPKVFNAISVDDNIRRKTSLLRVKDQL